jgi:dihydropteroate synthase
MGVLNLTPDSFSDDGLAADPLRAVDVALAMEESGADLIDIGAESTRPGAEPVSASVEIERLRPVLRALSGRLRIPFSIDTYKAETADFALDEGAALVNDVSGLEFDPDMGPLVARRGAPIVVMHSRGGSSQMYARAQYADVLGEVARDLQRRVERAVGSGVAWDRILLDPGLGFAKRAEHSFAALAGIARFADLGRPIVVGPSRKSFLTAAAGALDAFDRDWPTAAAVTASVLQGAHIVRVHRVAEMVRVVRVADAILAAAGEGGPQVDALPLSGSVNRAIPR